MTSVSAEFERLYWVGWIRLCWRSATLAIAGSRGGWSRNRPYFPEMCPTPRMWPACLGETRVWVTCVPKLPPPNRSPPRVLRRVVPASPGGQKVERVGCGRIGAQTLANADPRERPGRSPNHPPHQPRPRPGHRQPVAEARPPLGARRAGWGDLCLRVDACVAPPPSGSGGGPPPEGGVPPRWIEAQRPEPTGYPPAVL